MTELEIKQQIACILDKIWRLKIGLSKQDKLKMIDDITRDVLKQVSSGSPAYTGTASQILDLIENKGIAVATDTGFWYFFDVNLTDETHPNGKYVSSEMKYLSVNLEAKEILYKGNVGDKIDDNVEEAIDRVASFVTKPTYNKLNPAKTLKNQRLLEWNAGQTIDDYTYNREGSYTFNKIEVKEGERYYFSNGVGYPFAKYNTFKADGSLNRWGNLNPYDGLLMEKDDKYLVVGVPETQTVYVPTGKEMIQCIGNPGYHPYKPYFESSIPDIISESEDVSIDLDTNLLSSLLGKPIATLDRMDWEYPNVTYGYTIRLELNAKPEVNYSIFIGKYTSDSSIKGIVVYFSNEKGEDFDSRVILMNDESNIVSFKTPATTVRMKIGFTSSRENKPDKLGYQRVRSLLLYEGNISFVPEITSNAGESLKLPSYYIPYIYDKEQEIINKGNLSALNGDSFVFFTDYHTRSNSGHTNALISDILKNTGVRFVAFGGDILNTTNEKEEAERRILQFRNLFSFIPQHRMFMINGNHEFNNSSGMSGEPRTFNKSQVYNVLNKNEENEFIKGENVLSFYVNNLSQKIRYYYISCDMGGTYDKNEQKWVMESMQSVPDGWSIFVIAHSAIMDDRTPAVAIQFANIAEALDTVKTKGTYSYDGITYNYNNDVDVIGVICGHIHTDQSAVTAQGIPVISTTTDAYQLESGTLERVKGTISEQAFDVVNIDKTNRKIYLTRIGAGVDREFNY